MTPQTVKMLMMFFLAAALLNLTNYASYLFYKAPARNAVKLDVKVHAHSPRTRRFLAKSRATRAINWTASLSCFDKKISSSPSTEQTTIEAPNIDLADFVEPTTETNSFYYYNGVRMGPVMCPNIPPGLGPVKPDERINLEAIEHIHSVVQPGGIYDEMTCTPRQTVAIIVPCSGHSGQLTEFLYSLLPMLIKQQLDFQVFVIEQGNKSQPLNRGKLMNVGFTEAQKMKENGGWRCIVFHDHTLVPADSRNLYRCMEQPRQLAVSLDLNRSHELPFGPVIAIKPQQFKFVNGFSNLYLGNDAVYNDLLNRITESKLEITKSNTSIAQYTLVPPSTVETFMSYNQSQKIQTASPLNLLDGLSTLTYSVTKSDMKTLYTLIEADLDMDTSRPVDHVGAKVWDKILNQATSTPRLRAELPTTLHRKPL